MLTLLVLEWSVLITWIPEHMARRQRYRLLPVHHRKNVEMEYLPFGLWFVFKDKLSGSGKRFDDKEDLFDRLSGEQVRPRSSILHFPFPPDSIFLSIWSCSFGRMLGTNICHFSFLSLLFLSFFSSISLTLFVYLMFPTEYFSKSVNCSPVVKEEILEMTLF